MRIKSGWKPLREETSLVWVIPRRRVLHASPFNILMVHSIIILSYMPRPSRKPHSFGLSHQNSVSIYCLANACHTPGQAHINYYSNIWWRIQIVTLNPLSFWFLTHRSQMSSSATCLRKPSDCVLPVFSETKFHTPLTYSMVQSPSWEANWFASSQEIRRISRNPNVHYRTHKRPPTVYSGPAQSSPYTHIPLPVDPY